METRSEWRSSFFQLKTVHRPQRSAAYGLFISLTSLSFTVVETPITETRPLGLLNEACCPPRSTIDEESRAATQH